MEIKPTLHLIVKPEWHNIDKDGLPPTCTPYLVKRKDKFTVSYDVASCNITGKWFNRSGNEITQEVIAWREIE